jgi:hypothetical protein
MKIAINLVGVSYTELGRTRKYTDSYDSFVEYILAPLKEQGHDIVAQNGLFGQYVYIIRDKNAVVVRLGESKVVKHVHHFQPEIHSYAVAALSILK